MKLRKMVKITLYVRQQKRHRCIEQSTGCSGLVHWDDPEGWDGEGGGRGVQDGGHTYTHGGVESMYGKTNTTL